MSNDVGKVYLVGGGPGDPGLLSLRAKACLEMADVVLYDGLVNPAILEFARAECERTSRVGEGPRRRLDQDEINRQLVELGASGKTVVRLKGGDPYIFGRGSEEAQALKNAGIPFEVVPGVTAATAAGAYAGFSLTHRSQASAVAFITGHEDPGKPSSSLNYPALAAFPGTLVFYMGLHRLPVIAESLMQAGKSAETPAAVVSHASRVTQRTVVATLASLAEKVSAADLKPPSLIVVGDCVTQREEINWFEDLPLFGLSIGVARPADDFQSSASAIRQLGGEAVELATIQISPPTDNREFLSAIDDLANVDVIAFTSRFGVISFFSQLREHQLDARALAGIRLACIGASTADVLENESMLRPDLIASNSEASAFAEEIFTAFQPQTVLWPKSSRGRTVLQETLVEHGCRVVQPVAYVNEDVDAWPEPTVNRLLSGQIDWITLTSPSVAMGVARLLPAAAPRPRFVAISPLTADAASRAGLTVDCVAETATFASMLDAIATANTGGGGR